MKKLLGPDAIPRVTQMMDYLIMRKANSETVEIVIGSL